MVEVSLFTDHQMLNQTVQMEHFKNSIANVTDKNRDKPIRATCSLNSVTMNTVVKHENGKDNNGNDNAHHDKNTENEIDIGNYLDNFLTLFTHMALAHNPQPLNAF